MSDVICKVCGEPWEFYYLCHEEPGWKDTVLSGQGCPSCKGVKPDAEDRTLDWLMSLEEGTDEDPLQYI